MVNYTSPFSPIVFKDLPSLSGVKIATLRAGIRYENKDDVVLITLPPDSTIAGVFTTSGCPSAPVDWCKTLIKNHSSVRALVINSGNANAFTGKEGYQTVEYIAKQIACALPCRSEEVFIASTGIIGVPLDPRCFDNLYQRCLPNLSSSESKWLEAAKAIMTTDTYPKLSTRTITDPRLPSFTLNGIAKGSGMIAPHLGTMLSFIFTDCALPQDILQNCLSSAVERTFNCITVDSDQSTSDTVLLCSTGAVELPNDTDRLALTERFATELEALLKDLALQIVKDGEGITKLITITVNHATDDRSARAVAFSIANSPLVKTAIAGEDPNWGRIVMAVGKAGEPADRDRLSIWINDLMVAEQGKRFPTVDTFELAQSMKDANVSITVDLGLDKGSATVWTCDLTHNYIAINGSYST